MGFLISNTMIKILVGAAIVVGIVTVYEDSGHSDSTPCVSIENVPFHSAVYQCPAGLSTLAFQDRMGFPIYTTLTASVRSDSWLTTIGDKETLKSLPVNLGASAVIGPGAFMAISNGSGLVYVNAPSKVLLSVAWQNVPHN